MADRRRVKREPGAPATASAIASRSHEAFRQPPAENREAENNQKTVLIVDDHAEVLNSVSALLVSSNYNVLTASSGAEALRQSRNYKSEIHLLLSEIQMPMSGMDLAREIRIERPQIKVLLMSSAFPSDMRFSQGWHFLPKPFKSSHLPALVFDLIGTPAAGSGAPEPGAQGQPLSSVKTICPDLFSGDESTAAQARDLAVSGLFALNRFVITENSSKADAFLRGSVTEGAASATAGVLAAGAGAGDSGFCSAPETQRCVSVSLSLVNRNGDVIWAVSQDSSGERTKTALSDAIERGTQQLAKAFEEMQPS